MALKFFSILLLPLSKFITGALRCKITPFALISTKHLDVSIKHNSSFNIIDAEYEKLGNLPNLSALTITEYE